MKVLIIRFSSIGDIVLTTPVIRSIYKQIPHAEIHYLTKSVYLPLLQYNPYLTQIHTLKDNFSSLISSLKAEKFDYILDLHKNLRSWRVKQELRVPGKSFDKKNWSKYRMTRWKHDLKVDHIVKRYGDTLSVLGIELDREGLDFFVPESSIEQAHQIFLSYNIDVDNQPVIAVVLGASYATKRWKTEYFAPLLNKYRKTVLLIGGKDTLDEATSIVDKLNVPVINAVGTYDLLTSAALVKLCREVLAHDTGFMHIAAAFQKPIYSIWGNTVPEFGMTPYMTLHKIIEIKGLDCRPCSKLGYDSCPKKHFRCMNQLSPAVVLERMEDIEWQK